MGEVRTVGLDLAKALFQVHVADAAWRAVFRTRLRRNQVLGSLGSPQRCGVAMEAGSEAHFGMEPTRRDVLRHEASPNHRLPKQADQHPPLVILTAKEHRQQLQAAFRLINLKADDGAALRGAPQAAARRFGFTPSRRPVRRIMVRVAATSS